MTTHTIDATSKSIGRVASEAALLLMGKRAAAYERHQLPDIKVAIVHAGAVRITGAKPVQKTYTRYTGYPGGQRTLSLEQLIAKKGHAEAIRRAVRGMLPTNKLRAQALKKLHITE